MNTASSSAVRQQDRLALRRAILLAGRDHAFIQDKIDCAELALAADRPDIARPFFEMTFIRAGFALDRRIWQAEIAARTGFWPDEILDESGVVAKSMAAIDIAVHDLGKLIARHRPEPLSVPQAAALINTLVRALQPADFTLIASAQALRGMAQDDPPAAAITRTHRFALAPFAAAGAVPPPSAVFDAVAALHGGLRIADPDVDMLERLLDHVRRDYVEVPEFERVADIEDLDALAAACIAADLRDFLLANRVLAYAPSGSAELLHASARLNAVGLGHYFGNVSRLLRGSRDMFGLLQLAVGGAVKGDVLACWMPLLSSHLNPELTCDVVDELADRGLVRPIWALLEMVIRRSRPADDLGIVWRIRDAGLDLDNLSLAAAAQRVVACWARSNPTEWRILGEILATAGDMGESAHAFQLGWSLAPQNPVFAARLQALVNGDVAEFAVLRGFGTAEWRHDARRAFRLNRLPDPSATALARSPTH